MRLKSPVRVTLTLGVLVAFAATGAAGRPVQARVPAPSRPNSHASNSTNTAPPPSIIPAPRPVLSRKHVQGMVVTERRMLGTQILLPLGKPGVGPKGGGGHAKKSVPPDKEGNSTDATDTDPAQGNPDVPPTGTSSPDTPPTLYRGPESGLSPGTPIVDANPLVLQAGGLNPTAEPTAANDRDTILLTANSFAAISTDDGLTYSPIVDPTKAWDNQPDTPNGQGFCCDQRAYAIARGPHRSMLVWVLLNTDPTDENVGSIRLVVFRSRTDVSLFGSDPTHPVASTCSYVWTPADFDLKNRSFDFPQVASTDKYLYLSANAARGGFAREGVIWRVELAHLDDDCDGGIEDQVVVPSDDTLSPVQGAGSEMFFAHPRHGNVFHGDMLRIWRWRDSAKQPVFVDRDVNNYDQGTGENSFDCPLAGGADPCDNAGVPQAMSGFRSGSTVGWLWGAKQNRPVFPFPYVRVATFNTGTLDLIKDTEIYSRDAAWIYPSVAVNSRGDVGLTMMFAGDAFFPRMDAFLIKDPASGWPPQAQSLLTTSNAMPTSNRIGDYYSVQRYGNCPATFLATTESFRANPPSANVQVGSAWFGRPDDGCADLIPTATSVKADTPDGRVDRGGTIEITEATRNIGATTAPPSITRFFLSNDLTFDSRDQELGATRPQPEVAVGGTSPVVTTPASIPLIEAPGFHFLLACDDAASQVRELTQSNNCADAGAVFVNSQVATFHGELRSLNLSTTRVTPGSGVRLTSSMSVPHSEQGLLGGARITATLSPAPQANAFEVRLAVQRYTVGQRVRSGSRTRLPVSATVHIPARTGAGRWYLRVCVKPPNHAVIPVLGGICRASTSLSIER